MILNAWIYEEMLSQEEADFTSNSSDYFITWERGGRPEAYPTFYRLSDNSILGQKDDKKYALKALKWKRKNLLLNIIVRQAL